MAIDSSTKLTKFGSGSTIVTADFANSMFGGLYGTTEGDSLDADDPRVAGHVHDGVKADGHAQKINLVNHVTSQLTNSNLADDAVTKRNIQSFTNESSAIPVSEVIDGTTYYYLDIDEQETFSSITQSSTGTGSSSGGPLSADSGTDTLNFEADSGIEITLSDTGTDTVTVKNISTNFGIVGIASTETGEISGTHPIEAELLSDTLILEAGYGVELVGNSTTDTVKFRAQNSMTYSLLSLSAWDDGNSPSGWGAVQVKHYTDGDGDTLSYSYKITNDDDFIYTSLPIPQNAAGTRPTKFVFRAYFIAADEGTAYLQAVSPDPQFTVSLEIGSNDTQTDDLEKGTIEDGQDISAGGNNLWTTAVTATSSPVTGPNKYYILTWAEEVLLNNNIGLLNLRMTGTTGFAGAEDFDNGTNRGRAEFIKADLTWYY